MNEGTSSRSDNIKRLDRLLKRVPSSKEDELFEELSLELLRSQGALARHGLGMALNTCKRLADDCLDEGFLGFDRARLAALDILEGRRRRAGRPGRQTKRALEDRLKEADVRAGVLRQDLNHMTGALYLAMKRMREYAKEGNNSAMAARLVDDLEEVRARAAPAVNVVAPVE